MRKLTVCPDKFHGGNAIHSQRFEIPRWHLMISIGWPLVDFRPCREFPCAFGSFWQG